MSRLAVWLGATPGWNGDHLCAVIDVFWDFQKTLYRETHAHLEGGEMALYNHPVAVLNSGIVTADGRYVLETIGLEEAATWILPTRKLSADRKSTRLNSSHYLISYAVFCLKKKRRAHV